jgi:hypothetical protein
VHLRFPRRGSPEHPPGWRRLHSPRGLVQRHLDHLHTLPDQE